MKKILVGLMVLAIAGLLVTPAFAEGFLKEGTEVEGTVISAEEIAQELEKAQEASRENPTMENARTLQAVYAKYGVTVSDADLALLVEVLLGQRGIRGDIKEQGEKVMGKLDRIHNVLLGNSLWWIAESRKLNVWAYCEHNKKYPENGYRIFPGEKLEDYPKEKEAELIEAHLKRRDAWKAKQHNALLLRNKAAAEITSKVVPGIEELKKEHQEQFQKMETYYKGQITEIEALGEQMTTEHKAQIAQLTRQHKEIEVEMTEQHKAQVQEMTKQHESQISQLNGKLKVLAEQHELLGKQHLAMMEKNKGKVKELQTELVSATQKLEEKEMYWQERLEEITKEYEEKITKLQAELKTAPVLAREEFKKQVDALKEAKEKDIVAVRRERDKDISDLQSIISDLESRITSLEEQNADLRAENERLGAKLDSVQKQLAAKEKELRLVRVAKEELERKLEKVTRELEELRSRPPKVITKVETIKVPVEVERIVEKRTMPAIAKLGEKDFILEVNSSYLSGVRQAWVRGDFNSWGPDWLIKDTDADGWLEFDTTSLKPGTYRCSITQVETSSWAQYGDTEKQVPFMENVSFLFRNENIEEGYCVRFEKLADGSIKPAGNVKK